MQLLLNYINISLCICLGIDSLLASDWLKLQEVSTLLEPFALQTDILQTDAQSLSSIIPCILNLECHLQQHTAAKAITSKMLDDLRRRFATLLYPDTEHFNPIPAAACLLDPTMAQAMMSPECAVLLHAAKLYIATVCESQKNFNSSTDPSQPDDASSSSMLTPLSSLQRFKFLANKIQSNRLTTTSVSSNVSERDVIHTQVNNYIADIVEEEINDAFLFWEQKLSRYNKLSELAQDLMAAPASQAYVERIFSLCGFLTNGRRNRMHQSLEMRAFLKLNAF